MNIKQNPFSFYDFLGYFTPGAFFLYAFISIIPHISFFAELSTFINTNHNIDKVELYIPFVLISYIIGHILSFLSSVTVEIYSIWTVGYPSKYLLGIEIKPYMSIQEPKLINQIGRYVLPIILLPFVCLDFLIGRLLGLKSIYAKPLDKLLIDLIIRKVTALLNENKIYAEKKVKPKIRDDNYFRFVYHYCVEHAPNHFPKMQNYVALYGFLRTLTLLAVICFWILTSFICTGQLEICRGIFYLLLTSVCSYTLFMAFTKFYRRFSLEAFMALTAIYPKK